MLRHTCLTRLREAGMALEAVQAQAGHRSIESTRIYLHLTNAWLADEYRRAADRIEASHRAELLAMQDADPMSTAEHLNVVWSPVPAAQSRLGRPHRHGTAARRDPAPLPDPAHHVPGTAQRRRRRLDVAPVRPLAHRHHRHRQPIAEVRRSHIEDYKVWLAAQPGTQGPDPVEEHAAPTARA